MEAPNAANQGGLSVEAGVEHSPWISMRAVAGGAGRTRGQVRIGSSGTLDVAALNPARVAAVVGSGALEGSAIWGMPDIYSPSRLRGSTTRSRR